MEKTYFGELTAMLRNLAEQYNDYSQLVAFNYSQKSPADVTEWNRATREAAKDHLESLCELIGAVLEYETVKERFCGYELEYVRARKIVVKNGETAATLVY